MIEIKNMEAIVYPGTTINKAMTECFNLAVKYNSIVKFTFNGCYFEINKFTDINQLLADFFKSTNAR